jgi:FkbM family methyltransferase
MNLSAVFKPEYFYQPKIALQRLLPFKSASTAEFVDRKLPWGMDIRVRSLEEHGRILTTLGVIDLAVTEALWRLANPGELAVDVGANIGYMTAVLAERVGSGGHVYSFEAHPEIFAELKYNTELWQKQLINTKFDIQNIAISDAQGSVLLKIPDAFIDNRGLATVVTSKEFSKESDEHNFQTIKVESSSLDELFPAPKQIGVLKIDVEGHELQVLQGAKKLLKQQRIRDCVFEEHGEYPTNVTRYFEEMGYSIFRIHRKFFAPALLPPNVKIEGNQWLPISFLATREPESALSRFKETGWRVLQS